ncbi:MAG TPA: rod shape-determining protein MreC [Solirubrobacterales bacterium]
MYRKQVRRRRAVLALLIISSFVLLTITYGQSSGGLQRGVSTVFSPLQDAADRALKPARDLVDWFDKTFDARGENSKLKDELEVAREGAVAGQTAIQENAQLRKALGFNRSPAMVESGLDPVGARVVARAPIIWTSAVTIDAGSDDGVRPNDPVMSGSAMIGRVTSVEGGSAQVTLISDDSSAISAKILPGGIQGVMRPVIGDPEELILDYIETTEPIEIGSPVVTSGWEAQGLESRFPPDLPIGEITKAPLLEQEASQQVRLRPYADLPNIDLVQVLTGGSRR